MTEALPNLTPEAVPPVEEKLPNPERYKTLVVILTVLTTVITTVMACLQADANIRASIKNRDSQVDAILIAGELQRQGLQWAYDTNVFTAYLKDVQEATVMQLTALQQDGSGDTQDSLVSKQLATMAQARADTAQKFSVFFSDPRYAAKAADGMPDMNAYLTDSQAKANDLLAQQNAAADEYDRWNRKGDGFTTVLAILALAFFLFGLAQALSPRLRLLLAIFGIVALVGAAAWSIVIMLA